MNVDAIIQDITKKNSDIIKQALEAHFTAPNDEAMRRYRALVTEEESEKVQNIKGKK